MFSLSDYFGFGFTPQGGMVEGGGQLPYEKTKGCLSQNLN